MTSQTESRRDPPERLDRDHPSHTDPEDGGCWFCSRPVDFDRAGYCAEWGAFYHPDCARRLQLDMDDCPVEDYETSGSPLDLDR